MCSIHNDPAHLDAIRKATPPPRGSRAAAALATTAPSGAQNESVQSEAKSAQRPESTQSVREQKGELQQAPSDAEAADGKTGSKKRLSSSQKRCANPLSSQFLQPLKLPNWSDVYSEPSRPIMLDIGSARGTFLLRMAVRNTARI